MKYLLFGIIGITLPTLTDFLVDAHALRPSYTTQQAAALHQLQDRELRKDIGVLFIPKNERERAEVIAEVWGLQ